MATFNVSITNNTTPAVAVSLTNQTTYSQFKNSLGNFDYYVNKVYLYSTNQNQIQGAFNYTKYDSNGRLNAQSVLSVIDPYQYITSIYIDTQDKSLVLDGRDFVRFNLLPNTQLAIKLFANRVSVGDVDGMRSQYNFKQLEYYEGIPNFFEQYKEFL